MRVPAIPEIGLYVHVPFCQTKCGYCDFYSVPDAGQDLSGLVHALVQEIRRRTVGMSSRIRTVFAGGGTPTVLPLADLDRLVHAIAAATRPHELAEFTVEANPATLDRDKVNVLRRGGVDRMSFGAQSFDRAELRVLERIHQPEDVEKSVRLARGGGIARINLDLIFGIPGQDLESWLRSLEQAVRLEPDHLSLYGLTYEKGTPLTAARDRGQVRPCDESLEADMYLAGIERLERQGYEQYEISNFARPGQRCLHNLLYWNNDPYLGVGPSAVGYQDGVRYRNVPSVRRYVEMMKARGDAVVETERIGGALLAGETVMVQLRRVEGIDADQFQKRTGYDPFEVFAQSIERGQSAGLLERRGRRIFLTRPGMLLADSVIAEFMDELDTVAAPPAPPPSPPFSKGGEGGWPSVRRVRPLPVLEKEGRQLTR